MNGEVGMNFFRNRLEAYPRLAEYHLAQELGYWPYYKTVESAATPRFTIEGTDYINFGSNNYLSLSYHPQVIEAAQRATSKYGTGVTGSRLLNGTLDLHRELEDELADFYGREAALVFSTGYVANVSTIAGLLRRQDYAVLDKDAHNSLVTGAQLSGATLKRFSHNDVERLGRVLRDLPDDPGKAVIVDGVYSMGGETAPLDAMLEICREHPNTFLLDDEAHGLGVLGERGRGAAEHYGVLDTVDLITLTFSKTLGSCGGALIGSKEAIELLTLEADTFIFTASNTPGIDRRRAPRRAHPARRARDGREPARQRRPLRRPVGRSRRAGEPGRERDHHHPPAQARRGVGRRARSRAARRRRVREPGRVARGAEGPRPAPAEPDARPHAGDPRRGRASDAEGALRQRPAARGGNPALSSLRASGRTAVPSLRGDGARPG